MGRFKRLIYGLSGIILLAGGILHLVSVYLPADRLYELPPEFRHWLSVAMAVVSLVVGFILFAQSIFCRKRLHGLTRSTEGGGIYVSEKAIKACVHVTLTHYPYLHEGRMRLRVKSVRGSLVYSLRVWLGVYNGTQPALDDLGQEIQSRITGDLEHFTGTPPQKVDVIFYQLDSQNDTPDGTTEVTPHE